MRICFADASTGTIAGGTEALVSRLGRELLDRGHRVSLITGIDEAAGCRLLPQVLSVPWSSVVAVPFMSRLNPRVERVRSFWRLPLRYDVEALSFAWGIVRHVGARRELRQADVTSVHYPATSLLLTRGWSRRGPVVFHAPGHVPWHGFFRFDRSALYLANSRETDRRIAELTGRRADGVVSPGADFCAEVTPPRPIVGDPVFLAVMRVSRSKGIYRLLEIFARVRRELTQAQLIVAGPNGEPDEVAARARSLGVEQAVRAAGVVPHADMSVWYAGADLLIHPASRESFGMVVLEAMANGLPAVATRQPAFEESSGGCALLVAGDLDRDEWPGAVYDRWAGEIVRLVRDADRRKAMAASGRDYARFRTWAKQAAQYEAYLARAAAGGRQRA